MTAQTAPAALAALVVLPALTGLALLLAGRRADRSAGPVAVVAAAVTVALAVVVATLRPRATAPFLGLVDGGELALAVDGLSAVLVVGVAVVAAAVMVFAVADTARSSARARFFGYLLLFTAAMLATVTATTLPTLLLAWEVMGATSYALIGFHWYQAGKVAAGTTAFLATRAGDLGLYVAAGAALAGTGSLELTSLATVPGGWRDVAAAGVLLAALGKSAQLPFSAWLSAAMEGPSAVSALLHSATMVAAGGYLLLRLEPLLEGWAGPAAAWIGALTAVVLGLVAAAQTDLKQLLAASTAAQIGFVVLAAGVGSVAGGTAQLLAHAAVKAGLFVIAGAWLTSLGTKKLSELRGAARRHRGVGAAVTVTALALAGVPPLSLWVTKDWAMAGAEGPLRLTALVAAALSAVYAGRVLAVVLAAPPGARDSEPGREPHGTGRIPVSVAVVAWVFALVTPALALLGVPAVAERLALAVGDTAHPPSLGELAVSGAIAVVTLAVVVSRPPVLAPLRHGRLAGWAGLRALLSPRPWLAVARGAATVDEQVIDRGVHAAGALALRMATVLRRADDTILDGAVGALAAGTRRGGDAMAAVDGRVIDAAVMAFGAEVRRLGGFMRRPQTGLLHQYYAQALLGLGVLLVVLLVR
ncbi:proton-conducting transporter membrane subunit [Georgenia muralis]|uniref:NADH:ubiquinone oxidoreductase subunit 5 (Subunit L)/multisubunit Na+/H+ antiporter MnhA subunit n=1 Tax=Georgenia muralis TaxID=154117 RepID=A0A3N4Z7J2_9MICO|nr:proton-conducting transporter membrane subunit [Georgenia muralis]RPF28277.1 NADH:ubiquinone oxidoreductase subunit 5 (subunit L)/multisubunit Na+/H+ antiporter MnhA subunit [Georgenia muralis]